MYKRQVSEDRITLSGAYGVLGHDWVAAAYRGYVDFPSTRLQDQIHLYFSFDDDAAPIQLPPVYGETAQIDLDGDGEDELCAASMQTAQILFRRDGTVYEADCKSLLSAAWPQAQSLEFGDRKSVV